MPPTDIAKLRADHERKQAEAERSPVWKEHLAEKEAAIERMNAQREAREAKNGRATAAPNVTGRPYFEAGQGSGRPEIMPPLVETSTKRRCK
jgi:hypothetical protein